jgi:hypothetical protein
MAETPKLTSKDLAALIRVEQDQIRLLVLIEEFCKSYDAEQKARQEMNRPQGRTHSSSTVD